MVMEVAAVAVSIAEHLVASSSFESSSLSSNRILDLNLTTRGKRFAMVDDVNFDVSSSLSALVMSAQLLLCCSKSGVRSSVLDGRYAALGGRDDLEVASVAIGAVPSSYAAVHKSRI